MCGIAGIVSSFLTDKEKSVFCDLLRVNTLRGSHSTGLMAAFRQDNTPSYMVAKTTRNAVSALDTPSAEIKAIFERKDPCTALIGHTRAATRGSVHIRNAHPFVFPNVIGVHNGTISTDLIHEKLYDTDSEALYRDINDRGLQTALKEINKGWPGYALVMFDKENDNLIVIRNVMRPLHFTFNSSRNTLFFSSESGALRYVLGRHNMLYKEQVFPALKENVAMTMPVSYDALAKMDFTPMEVKERPRVYYTSSGGSYSKAPAPAAATRVFPSPSKPPSKPAPITLASSVKQGPFAAPDGMSKKAKKKFQKALRKQAKVSAMLAKQREQEAEESESTGGKKEGFGSGNTPGFLQGPTSRRIRNFFKPKIIHEDEKSGVLHQSALFEDVKEAPTSLGDEPPKHPDLLPEVDELNDDLPWGDTQEEEYVGAYGEIHTREAMEKILANGCSWCAQPEKIEFHQRVEWLDREQYVCAECMDTNEDVMMYFGRTAKMQYH